MSLAESNLAGGLPRSGLEEPGYSLADHAELGGTVAELEAINARVPHREFITRELADGSHEFPMAREVVDGHARVLQIPPDRGGSTAWGTYLLEAHGYVNGDER